jgi:hypothetical protein
MHIPVVIAADDTGVLEVDQVLLRQCRQLVQYLVGGIFTLKPTTIKLLIPHLLWLVHPLWPLTGPPTWSMTSA